MIRPELDALLQGALDNTLTPEERDRLGRLMSESPEARARAAQLGQLTTLLDSLGPADAPLGLVHDVLARISNQPLSIHPSAPRRGTPVNKKILFGLAAAAAVVLAVITYSTNPPATEGTEATIGAAQRAQAPQIAAKDVALGDTSAQDVLQTELWDQLAKDEDLRNLLTDADFREGLADLELRNALGQEATVKALQALSTQKLVEQQAMLKQLDQAEAAKKKYADANMRWLAANPAMVKALQNEKMRALMLRPEVAKAMARAEFQNALRNQTFLRWLNSPQFSAHMSRSAKKSQ